MDAQKKKVVIVAVVIILVGGLVWFFSSQKPTSNSGAPPPAANKTPPPAPAGPVTREAAPKNVVVPEMGASAPPGVAIPQNVAPANTTAGTSFRMFNVKMQAGTFLPNEIIVYQGDGVKVSITAVDQNYDFFQPDYLGNKIAIAKGKTWAWIFDATAAGKFKFYCPSCGGPAKGPVGYLIVKPK